MERLGRGSIESSVFDIARLCGRDPKIKRVRAKLEPRRLWGGGRDGQSEAAAEVASGLGSAPAAAGESGTEVAHPDLHQASATP